MFYPSKMYINIKQKVKNVDTFFNEEKCSFNNFIKNTFTDRVKFEKNVSG